MSNTKDNERSKGKREKSANSSNKSRGPTENHDLQKPLEKQNLDKGKVKEYNRGPTILPSDDFGKNSKKGGKASMVVPQQQNNGSKDRGSRAGHKSKERFIPPSFLPDAKEKTHDIDTKSRRSKSVPKISLLEKVHKENIQAEAGFIKAEEYQKKEKAKVFQEIARKIVAEDKTAHKVVGYKSPKLKREVTRDKNDDKGKSKVTNESVKSRAKSEPRKKTVDDNDNARPYENLNLKTRHAQESSVAEGKLKRPDAGSSKANAKKTYITLGDAENNRKNDNAPAQHQDLGAKEHSRTSPTKKSLARDNQSPLQKDLDKKEPERTSPARKASVENSRSPRQKLYGKNESETTYLTNRELDKNVQSPITKQPLDTIESGIVSVAKKTFEKISQSPLKKKSVERKDILSPQKSTLEKKGRSPFRKQPFNSEEFEVLSPQRSAHEKKGQSPLKKPPFDTKHFEVTSPKRNSSEKNGRSPLKEQPSDTKEFEVLSPEMSTHEKKGQSTFKKQTLDTKESNIMSPKRSKNSRSPFQNQPFDAKELEILSTERSADEKVSFKKQPLDTEGSEIMSPKRSKLEKNGLSPFNKQPFDTKDFELLSPERDMQEKKGQSPLKMHSLDTKESRILSPKFNTLERNDRSQLKKSLLTSKESDILLQTKKASETFGQSPMKKELVDTKGADIMSPKNGQSPLKKQPLDPKECVMIKKQTFDASPKKKAMDDNDMLPLTKQPSAAKKKKNPTETRKIEENFGDLAKSLISAADRHPFVNQPKQNESEKIMPFGVMCNETFHEGSSFNEVRTIKNNLNELKDKTPKPEQRNFTADNRKRETSCDKGKGEKSKVSDVRWLPKELKDIASTASKDESFKNESDEHTRLKSPEVTRNELFAKDGGSFKNTVQGDAAKSPDKQDLKEKGNMTLDDCTNELISRGIPYSVLSGRSDTHQRKSNKTEVRRTSRCNSPIRDESLRDGKRCRSQSRKGQDSCNEEYKSPVRDSDHPDIEQSSYGSKPMSIRVIGSPNNKKKCKRKKKSKNRLKPSKSKSQHSFSSRCESEPKSKRSQSQDSVRPRRRDSSHCTPRCEDDDCPGINDNDDGSNFLYNGGNIGTPFTPADPTIGIFRRISKAVGGQLQCIAGNCGRFRVPGGLGFYHPDSTITGWLGQVHCDNDTLSCCSFETNSDCARRRANERINIDHDYDDDTLDNEVTGGILDSHGGDTDEESKSLVSKKAKCAKIKARKQKEPKKNIQEKKKSEVVDKVGDSRREELEKGVIKKEIKRNSVKKEEPLVKGTKETPDAGQSNETELKEKKRRSITITNRSETENQEPTADAEPEDEEIMEERRQSMNITNELDTRSDVSPEEETWKQERKQSSKNEKRSEIENLEIMDDTQPEDDEKMEQRRQSTKTDTVKKESQTKGLPREESKRDERKQSGKIRNGSEIEKGEREDKGDEIKQSTDHEKYSENRERQTISLEEQNPSELFSPSLGQISNDATALPEDPSALYNGEPVRERVTDVRDSLPDNFAHSEESNNRASMKSRDQQDYIEASSLIDSLKSESISPPVTRNSKNIEEEYNQSKVSSSSISSRPPQGRICDNASRPPPCKIKCQQYLKRQYMSPRERQRPVEISKLSSPEISSKNVCAGRQTNVSRPSPASTYRPPRRDCSRKEDSKTVSPTINDSKRHISPKGCKWDEMRHSSPGMDRGWKEKYLDSSDKSSPRGRYIYESNKTSINSDQSREKHFEKRDNRKSSSRHNSVEFLSKRPVKDYPSSSSPRRSNFLRSFEQKWVPVTESLKYGAREYLSGSYQKKGRSGEAIYANMSGEYSTFSADSSPSRNIHRWFTDLDRLESQMVSKYENRRSASVSKRSSRSKPSIMSNCTLTESDSEISKYPTEKSSIAHGEASGQCAETDNTTSESACLDKSNVVYSRLSSDSMSQDRTSPKRKITNLGCYSSKGDEDDTSDATIECCDDDFGSSESSESSECETLNSTQYTDYRDGGDNNSKTAKRKFRGRIVIKQPHGVTQLPEVSIQNLRVQVGCRKDDSGSTLPRNLQRYITNNRTYNRCQNTDSDSDKWAPLARSRTTVPAVRCRDHLQSPSMTSRRPGGKECRSYSKSSERVVHSKRAIAEMSPCHESDLMATTNSRKQRALQTRPKKHDYCEEQKIDCFEQVITPEQSTGICKVESGQPVPSYFQDDCTKRKTQNDSTCVFSKDMGASISAAKVQAEYDKVCCFQEYIFNDDLMDTARPERSLRFDGISRDSLAVDTDYDDFSSMDFMALWPKDKNASSCVDNNYSSSAGIEDGDHDQARYTSSLTGLMKLIDGNLKSLSESTRKFGDLGCFQKTKDKASPEKETSLVAEMVLPINESQKMCTRIKQDGCRALMYASNMTKLASSVSFWESNSEELFTEDPDDESDEVQISSISSHFTTVKKDMGTQTLQELKSNKCTDVSSEAEKSKIENENHLKHEIDNDRQDLNEELSQNTNSCNSPKFPPENNKDIKEVCSNIDIDTSCCQNSLKKSDGVSESDLKAINNDEKNFISDCTNCITEEMSQTKSKDTCPDNPSNEKDNLITDDQNNPRKTHSSGDYTNGRVSSQSSLSEEPSKINSMSWCDEEDNASTNNSGSEIFETFYDGMYASNSFHKHTYQSKPNEYNKHLKNNYFQMTPSRGPSTHQPLNLLMCRTCKCLVCLHDYKEKESTNQMQSFVCQGQRHKIKKISSDMRPSCSAHDDYEKEPECNKICQSPDETDSSTTEEEEHEEKFDSFSDSFLKWVKVKLMQEIKELGAKLFRSAVCNEWKTMNKTALRGSSVDFTNVCFDHYARCPKIKFEPTHNGKSCNNIITNSTCPAMPTRDEQNKSCSHLNRQCEKQAFLRNEWAEGSSVDHPFLTQCIKCNNYFAETPNLDREIKRSFGSNVDHPFVSRLCQYQNESAETLKSDCRTEKENESSVDNPFLLQYIKCRNCYEEIPTVDCPNKNVFGSSVDNVFLANLIKCQNCLAETPNQDCENEKRIGSSVDNAFLAKLIKSQNSQKESSNQDCENEKTSGSSVDNAFLAKLIRCQNSHKGTPNLDYENEKTLGSSVDNAFLAKQIRCQNSHKGTPNLDCENEKTFGSSVDNAFLARLIRCQNSHKGTPNLDYENEKTFGSSVDNAFLAKLIRCQNSHKGTPNQDCENKKTFGSSVDAPLFNQYTKYQTCYAETPNMDCGDEKKFGSSVDDPFLNRYSKYQTCHAETPNVDCVEEKKFGSSVDNPFLIRYVNCQKHISEIHNVERRNEKVFGSSVDCPGLSRFVKRRSYLSEAPNCDKRNERGLGSSVDHPCLSSRVKPQICIAETPSSESEDESDVGSSVDHPCLKQYTKHQTHYAEKVSDESSLTSSPSSCNDDDQRYETRTSTTYNKSSESEDGKEEKGIGVFEQAKKKKRKSRSRGNARSEGASKGRKLRYDNLGSKKKRKSRRQSKRKKRSLRQATLLAIEKLSLFNPQTLAFDRENNTCSNDCSNDPVYRQPVITRADLVIRKFISSFFDPVSFRSSFLKNETSAKAKGSDLLKPFSNVDPAANFVKTYLCLSSRSRRRLTKRSNIYDAPFSHTKLCSSNISQNSTKIFELQNNTLSSKLGEKKLKLYESGAGDQIEHNSLYPKRQWPPAKIRDLGRNEPDNTIQLSTTHYSRLRSPEKSIYLKSNELNNRIQDDILHRYGPTSPAKNMNLELIEMGDKKKHDSPGHDRPWPLAKNMNLELSDLDYKIHHDSSPLRKPWSPAQSKNLENSKLDNTSNQNSPHLTRPLSAEWKSCLEYISKKNDIEKNSKEHHTPLHLKPTSMTDIEKKYSLPSYIQPPSPARKPCFESSKPATNKENHTPLLKPSSLRWEVNSQTATSSVVNKYNSPSLMKPSSPALKTCYLESIKPDGNEENHKLHLLKPLSSKCNTSYESTTNDDKCKYSLPSFIKPLSPFDISNLESSQSKGKRKYDLNYLMNPLSPERSTNLGFSTSDTQRKYDLPGLMKPLSQAVNTNLEFSKSDSQRKYDLPYHTKPLSQAVNTNLEFSKSDSQRKYDLPCLMKPLSQAVNTNLEFSKSDSQRKYDLPCLMKPLSQAVNTNLEFSNSDSQRKYDLPCLMKPLSQAVNTNLEFNKPDRQRKYDLPCLMKPLSLTGNANLESSKSDGDKKYDLLCKSNPMSAAYNIDSEYSKFIHKSLMRKLNLGVSPRQERSSNNDDSKFSNSNRAFLTNTNVSSARESRSYLNDFKDWNQNANEGIGDSSPYQNLSVSSNETDDEMDIDKLPFTGFSPNVFMPQSINRSEGVLDFPAMCKNELTKREDKLSSFLKRFEHKLSRGKDDKPSDLLRNDIQFAEFACKNLNSSGNIFDSFSRDDDAVDKNDDYEDGEEDFHSAEEGVTPYIQRVSVGDYWDAGCSCCRVVDICNHRQFSIADECTKKHIQNLRNNCTCLLKHCSEEKNKMKNLHHYQAPNHFECLHNACEAICFSNNRSEQEDRNIIFPLCTALSEKGRENPQIFQTSENCPRKNKPHTIREFVNWYVNDEGNKSIKDQAMKEHQTTSNPVICNKSESKNERQIYALKSSHSINVDSKATLDRQILNTKEMKITSDKVVEKDESDTSESSSSNEKSDENSIDYSGVELMGKKLLAGVENKRVNEEKRKNCYRGVKKNENYGEPRNEKCKDPVNRQASKNKRARMLIKHNRESSCVKGDGKYIKEADHRASHSKSLEDIEVPEVEKERVRFACDKDGDWAEVGRGSYGCVYLGLLDGKIEVAIKDFFESNSYDHIIHEARMLVYLQKTGITPRFYGLRRRFDVKKHPGEFCIIMEYFGDGKTLFNVLSEKIELATNEWIDVLGQLVAGLRLIHKMNVLLNDLKADNILIDLFGGRKTIRYIDVGMATYKQGLAFQLPQNQMGKYNFLAPEVRDGVHTSKRSDIYSLGYMLDQILRVAGSPLGGLESLVNHCMKEDPNKRPNVDAIVSSVHKFVDSSLEAKRGAGKRNLPLQKSV